MPDMLSSLSNGKSSTNLSLLSLIHISFRLIWNLILWEQYRSVLSSKIFWVFSYLCCFYPSRFLLIILLFNILIISNQLNELLMCFQHIFYSQSQSFLFLIFCLAINWWISIFDFDPFLYHSSELCWGKIAKFHVVHLNCNSLKLFNKYIVTPF